LISLTTSKRSPGSGCRDRAGAVPRHRALAAPPGQHGQSARSQGIAPAHAMLEPWPTRHEFSWCAPATTFPGMPRRYYYQYYGAWGGLGRRLRPGRPPALHSQAARHPPDVGGPPRHEAIERSLLALRDGHGLSEASLIEDTVRQMREEWKGSRAGSTGRPRSALAVRARVRRGHPRQRVGGALRDSRGPLPAELPPAARADRHQAHADRALGLHRGHRLLPLRGHARVQRGPTSATGATATGWQLLDWKTGGAAEGPGSSSAATPSTPSTCWASTVGR